MKISLLLIPGNLPRNDIEPLGLRSGSGLNLPKFPKFPVKFPVSRECGQRLVRSTLVRLSPNGHLGGSISTVWIALFQHFQLRCTLLTGGSARKIRCGAPRIHGELLKLGFEVAQSSVAKYMVKRCGPPSQGWRTFLGNHAPDIAAMDLFVVPTIGFDLLYVLVIVWLGRRDLVWINVTTNPTAEWIARQITEAFPWNEAPRYLIRDRDCVYGLPSPADCAPWASVTSPSPQARLGRTVSPKG